MKALFLNGYFYPEQCSLVNIQKELIEGIVAGDNEIFVVCPIPTRGISKEVAEEYRNIKRQELYDGKVKVHRFWAPQEGRNPLIRAFRYFWCNFRTISIAGRYKDADAILAMSTPPIQGFFAGMVAKRLKIPFVYGLQDVFPDSLVTTGLSTKGSILWKIGRKVEDYTYNHADKIIVISESMKRNILEKGVPEEKITVVSNWIDTNLVVPVDKENNALFEEFGIDKNKFTVLYAGNFGAAQGADVVLRAAELLKADTDIQFVIFGGGAEFENAKTFVEEKSLSNVIINGLLGQERMSEVYSVGDVALITCKKGVGTSGMPSKTWSIMACNKPIIASFDEDSELAEIIARANAGVCVEPENVQLLADEILKAKEKNAVCNSREYVIENASREKCVEKYIKVLDTYSKTEKKEEVLQTVR